MICPACNKNRDKVIDSREAAYGVRRRRLCLECEHRWTTVELNHCFEARIEGAMRTLRGALREMSGALGHAKVRQPAHVKTSGLPPRRKAPE